MKFLIVLCAALACAVAKPQQLGVRLAIPDGYAWTSARLDAPIAYAAAPMAYAAAPMAYSAAPMAYAAPVVAAAPLPAAAKTQYLGLAGYGHRVIAAPAAYAAPVAAVHTGPVLRDAIQTTVVNTPGHAVSYRVD